MRKFIALFTAVMFLAACSYLPVTRGYLEEQMALLKQEQTKQNYITKEQAEQILKKLTENSEKTAELEDMFSRFYELLESTAANKIRAFTRIHNNGASGAMDAVSCQDLATNDLGFANDVSLGSIAFYKYDSTDTTTEDLTNYTAIEPNDVDANCSSNGRWLLFSSFLFAGVANPAVNFKDSDQAHQTVAKIYANANDANDSYLYFQVEVATSLSTFLTLDGVKEIISSTYPLTAGVYILSISSSCTIGTDCDSTSLAVAYNGLIHVTNTATVTLPAIANGMSIAIDAQAAVVVTIDPNASDGIKLDGGTIQTDGVTIVSGGTAGEMAVCTYYSAAGWACNTDGWSQGS